MRSWKLWSGFVLWEALALLMGLLIADNFSQPGGGFNSGAFVGAMIGMALLWWAIVFAITACIDYLKGTSDTPTGN